MKKVMFLFLAMFVGVALGGCQKGTVRADAIAGLVDDVSARHDKMLRGELDPKDLNGDGKVDGRDDEDRATYLRSAEILRRIIKEARAP